MTGSSGLRTTLEDGTLLVELNRPEKRNALDEALQSELLQLFTDAASDREVRGVILTGSGEAFSAGGDPLDASEAYRHGLVTRVAPHDKLLDEARQRLRHIFMRAPQAYGLTKR